MLLFDADITLPQNLRLDGHPSCRSLAVRREPSTPGCFTPFDQLWLNWLEGGLASLK